MKLIYTMFGAMMLTMITSCSDDDSGQPAMESFTVTVENAFESHDYFMSGVFNTPVGESGPGPAVSGQSYEFSFYAGPGHRLSFATMFVQSNDLFYAPGDEGIALYEGRNPISGDITDRIDLWDAGTEVNETPYEGDNQAPRQSGANTGAEEGGNVLKIGDVDDGFDYPVDEDVIRVMISSDEDQLFTVSVLNISEGNYATPFAPGTFVVHNEGQFPLFRAGMADFGNGLEAVAEDGDATSLGGSLASQTGYSSPFAPGVFAVHSNGVTPIFNSGSADAGEGLEALAEDGDPTALALAVSEADGVSTSGAFNTPDGSSSAGPILPGGSYSFTFQAVDGERLSIATMLVQTNDLFYAFGEAGIALFENGEPAVGDVTNQLMLWDAGTEVNEFPGAGANQAPRQSGANTGTAEGGNVRLVNDAFSYPETISAIRVTISAN